MTSHFAQNLFSVLHIEPCELSLLFKYVLLKKHLDIKNSMTRQKVIGVVLKVKDMHFTKSCLN